MARATHGVWMNQPTSARDLVQACLAGFRELTARDAEALAQFTAFADAHPDCCERTCVPGHFTGSAWLVSADGERALLLHHRKLDIWVQPGGHADGDGDLAGVALREAEEETGLRGLRLEGGVFDLDRHAIPARGKDPEHFHYDVRFVVRAGADEAFVVNEESHALAWVPMRDIAADPHADESVRRMARKWLAR
jgi:8-oxo-dGTP pyrophosphatase MutT (NUDIX family)